MSGGVEGSRGAIPVTPSDRVLGLRVGFSKLGTECSKDGLGLQVPATGKRVPYFLRQVVTSDRDHWNLRAVSRIRKGSSHWC